MKIELGTPVQITWDDAWSSSEYYTYNAVKNATPAMLETVGHIMRYDKHVIVLGREREPGKDEYRYINCIPSKLIRKIKVLK